MQFGTLSTIDGKAAAGDADSVFKRDQIKSFGEHDVVLGVGDFFFLAPFANEGVGVFVFSDGAVVVRKVGDGQEEAHLVFFGFGRLLVEDGDFVPDDADLFLNGFDFVSFALAHEGSDLLGKCLAFGLKTLLVGFGFAADFVVGEDFFDEGMRTTSPSEDTAFYQFGVFAKELDVEHCAAV